MPSNQEIFEGGELMSHTPCDWNPADNVRETNGSVEAIYQYSGSFYYLYLNFPMDAVYDPAFRPIKALMD